MENKEKNDKKLEGTVDLESNLTFFEEENFEKNIPNKIEKKNPHSKAKTALLLFGLAACVFCSAFPTAGLGPTLGKISYDFNDTKNMSWYMTAYGLPSAILQLLCVRIGDCFGRRRVFLTSMVLFLIVIIIGGFSINSPMLIACRAIQGCLSGLCQTSVVASIVDMFEIQERVLYEPMVFAAFGITNVVGPVLGGLFVDHLSWRFIFWTTAIIFLPSMTIVYFLLEIPIKSDQTLSRENVKTLLKRIDPVGCILAATGIVFFLLGMHFPSASLGYTWSSPIVVGFLVGSGSILILFLVFEKFITPCPLFPSKIILDLQLLFVYIQKCTNGFCFIFFDVLVFIHFQAVYDATATQAASRLIPGTIFIVIGSITGSKLTKKLGNAKYINMLGNFLNVLACILILYVETPDSGIPLQIICLIIFNAGMGFSSQSNGASMQLILEKKAPELIATALSLSQFLVISSGALCVAVIITMLRTQVEGQVQSFKFTQPNIYQAILDSGAHENYIKVREITSKDLHYIVQTIYYNSIHNIVYMFLSLCTIGLICSFLLKTPSFSSIKQDKEESKK